MAMLLNHEPLAQVRPHSPVCGMDSVFDWDNVKWPVLIFSMLDAHRTGKLGAACLMSSENQESVTIAIAILQWNIPCTEAECKHPSRFYQLQNEEGEVYGWYVLDN
jgi:hypothetical protein